MHAQSIEAMNSQQRSIIEPPLSWSSSVFDAYRRFARLAGYQS